MLFFGGGGRQEEREEKKERGRKKEKLSEGNISSGGTYIYFVKSSKDGIAIPSVLETPTLVTTHIPLPGE